MMEKFKYLFITPEAIDHLISSRCYQSAEFREAEPLISFLRGNTASFSDGTVFSIALEEGAILHAGNIKKRRAGIFFDFVQYPGFLTESGPRMITIFQKMLKYAARYFSGHTKLAPCENRRDDNAIIFPFPYARHGESYRVVADRNTYGNGQTLNFLTVYYGGNEEVGPLSDYAQLDRFYREYNNLDEVQPAKAPGVSKKTEEDGTAFVRHSLASPDFKMGEGLTADEWEPYLTEPQRKFINSGIRGAERLQGAAGTGKTLSMVLKCIRLFKDSDYKKRFIFITHSLASKRHIIDLFLSLSPDIVDYVSDESSLSGRIMITTVQEWCIRNLGTVISEAECLDRDAMSSKQITGMYIEEAMSEVEKEYLGLYRPALSEEFRQFMTSAERQTVCDMLQYEFGVVLKGKADGDLGKYKQLERPKYAIPCKSDTDFNYIYHIYQKYQNQLIAEGYFDNDDIVLTALSSLNAPIWRRRRDRDGFDACFIDETHLFNFNELSIFPFLNKTDCAGNIVFAMDEAQFTGEVFNHAEDVLSMALGTKIDEENKADYNTVFRSSGAILELASNILAGGADLYNNFPDTLLDAEVVDAEESGKSFHPLYLMASDEESMVRTAFEEVDRLVKEYRIPRAECLLVSTSDSLTEEMKKYCENNRGCGIAQLASRGDSQSVVRARTAKQYLMAGIDYVGGLEFDYVVIVGVDENRVPPSSQKEGQDFHFVNYAWHRRMYVALTRARYGAIMVGNRTHGSAYMFENARIKKLLEYREQ